MSIFKLKTDVSELKSSNQGCTDLKYSEYLPTRDVTQDSFPTGRFVIPWEMSAEQHWIPSRSYLRMRCELTKGNADNITQTQLTVGDQIAPNMNLCANLFQSMELQLNGKTISRVSDHVAEVDTVEQRLSKSKAWMDSIGASVNWLQEDINDRINAVSSDGTSMNKNQINDQKGLELADDAKITPGGSSNEIKIEAGASATLPTVAILIAGNMKVGNFLGFAGGVYKILSNPVVATGGADGAGPYLVTIDATLPTLANSTVGANDLRIFDSITYDKAPSRKVTGFELIWRPLCLSVFKYSGALPTGNYSLICTPHNASGNNYKIRAIETPASRATPTFGKGATDIVFKVADVRMFVCNVTGPRVEDTKYFIDLEETRCQKALLKNTGNLTKEYFDVAPSTYGMTLAFADKDTGIDSKYSSSRFRVRNGSELKLQRLFISYGNRNFPQPDAEPAYKVGNADDYTTQRYVETSINSGAYFSEGGGETIDEWQRRGALHYFQTPKDGQDRSTRATVNCQFATQFDNTANICLFDHSRKAVQVTIQRGVVTDVSEFME
jgi:hypothetical protein